MMKRRYSIVVLAVLSLSGEASAQFGSGLPVIITEPSPDPVSLLSSSSTILLPELDSQDLALLERAAQASTQASVEAPAVQITNVLDDEEETDTPQLNQGAVVAEVAEAPSFMQIISLVQDLADASARGSAEVQEVIKDIKECLSKIADNAEYVSTLAEICGQLKELPQEIVQQISGVLGARLRSAVAKWQLTAKNYSSFIDLAAVFPEVVTETMVAGLRTIIERAIEKGDLTKLIIALIELSSLPEGLARMLVELSNKHADKFMAELKEGRGLYAFMQLISRYPAKLGELLKHSNAEVLKKVLDSADSPEGVAIEGMRLGCFVANFVTINPAEFVRLMSIDWESPIVTNVARKYPSLVIRHSVWDKTESLAEYDGKAFVKLSWKLLKGEQFYYFDDDDDPCVNDDWTIGMHFLARHNPRAFVHLLTFGWHDWYVADKMVMYMDPPVELAKYIERFRLRMAKSHPELVIRCSDRVETESLAERYPNLFVSFLGRSADFLGDKHLRKGLKFLATQHSEAFLELLKCWLKRPTKQLSIAYKVVQKYQEVLTKCSREIGSRYDDLLQQLFANLPKEHSSDDKSDSSAEDDEPESPGNFPPEKQHRFDTSGVMYSLSNPNYSPANPSYLPNSPQGGGTGGTGGTAGTAAL